MVFSSLGHFTKRTVGEAKSLKLKAKRKLGLFEPVEILPFRGYGTSTRVSLSGRVIETDGVVHRQPGVGDSPLRNLRASVRRLRSDEIPGACLQLRLGSKVVEVETDKEGYFDAFLEPDEPLEPGWHDVQLTLLSSVAGCEGIEATGHVLVPPDDAAFGVISDIDDTVIYSGVTQRLKMYRIVLFQNAHTRIPFPGVASFYRALKLGPDGKGSNPIFYVSRSPWNLYDLFENFFRAHDIPRGPLFLRDLHFFEPRSPMVGKEQDKLTRIQKLFDLYPRLPFVLVGDSGQKDPEIYAQIARENPGRIKAIYIRDVASRRREREVHALAEALALERVPMMLVRETLLAAQHAVEAGLVAPWSLEDVARKKREDEQEQ